MNIIKDIDKMIKVLDCLIDFYKLLSAKELSNNLLEIRDLVLRIKKENDLFKRRNVGLSLREILMIASPGDIINNDSKNLLPLIVYEDGVYIKYSKERYAFDIEDALSNNWRIVRNIDDDKKDT